MSTHTDKHDRNTAVVTAVHVARDWAIEQHGNRHFTEREVREYMRGWLRRNGANNDGLSDILIDLVDAVWALAELPQQDPLTLVEDDYRGTSEEARDMLTAQYERDLTDALNRITWKA